MNDLIQFSLVDSFNGARTRLLMARQAFGDNCRVSLCAWQGIELLHVFSKCHGECRVSWNQHAAIGWHQLRQVERGQRGLFPTAYFAMCSE